MSFMQQTLNIVNMKFEGSSVLVMGDTDMVPVLVGRLHVNSDECLGRHELV